MRVARRIPYHSLYQAFRHKADWNDSEPLSFDGGEIYNLRYVSRNAIHLLGHQLYYCRQHDVTFEGEATNETAPAPDCQIYENICFRYPLVRLLSGVPRRRHGRVTILLHGLNERTYSKYLPLACELCAATGAPVLLFPLALHMNRVYPGWARVQRSICDRRRRFANNLFIHPFNAVISDRLEQQPERFFWGAIQSYLDLVDLARDIRSGRHPHFSEGARVDFLGYSAGGYISFFLLLENPEQLLADSRGALFASCVPARDLSLASPLILDLAAETALMKIFVKGTEERASLRMRHWFDSHGEGRSFRTLTGIRADRVKLEARVRQIAPRVLGIAIRAMM
jgi:pimeloyl-ACP methyl ester carboxylesterase